LKRIYICVRKRRIKKKDKEDGKEEKKEDMVLINTHAHTGAHKPTGVDI
jgi:hypothetical protein